MSSIPRDLMGYVYFVRCPMNGRIKIGFTRHHPDQRLTLLRAANASELERVAVIPTVAATETDLLMLFFEYRTHSEWFEPGPRLLDFIAERGEPWPSPDESRPGPDGEAKWAKRCGWFLDYAIKNLTAREIQKANDRADEILAARGMARVSP